MRVTNLTENSGVYTSNVYLVRGTWNTMDDVNTLVDVGRDVRVIQALHEAATGVGKKILEQVVLTHSHYDHCEMLPDIMSEFSPEVYAASSSLKLVDKILKNHQMIRIGDMDFEVIMCDAHSSDSVCLYSAESGVLFSGDTPLVIQNPGTEYTMEFLNILKQLVGRGITTIYPGHGAPIVGNCNELLRTTIKVLKQEYADV